MNLNKVQIIGRVTQDLELKQAPNGNSVVNFPVATNRHWTDSSGNKQEQTEFHTIEMWGKLADIAGQYLVKGQEVYIEGRLQTKSWEAEDGSKRYKTSIVAEQMQMGNKPNGGWSSTSKPSNSTTKEEDVVDDTMPF